MHLRFKTYDLRLRQADRAVCAAQPHAAKSEFVNQKSKIRRGFTLIEILLALALVSLMLLAMNTFVFSMGELWGKGTDVRLFDQHVRAVTRFLEQNIRSAVLPPSARVGATPLSVPEIRPQTGLSDNLVTFDLLDGCRILTWPDRPLPEVVCSLQVREREGLYMLWHSRLEKNFDTDPPRELLLTQFVTKLSYDYYDADLKQWATETTFRRDQNGQPMVPQRLRLAFTYGKLTREALINLPTAAQGQPNF